MKNTIVGTNTKIEIIAPRADRRRAVADSRRKDRYAASKHVDSVVPAAVADTVRRDLDGNPINRPYTASEIDARAVARRDRDIEMFTHLSMIGVSRHELGRIFDRRAPHASRSTAERKHGNRQPELETASLAYATGLLNNANGLHANGKPMPLRYLNRGERERVLVARFAEAAVPLAA